MSNSLEILYEDNHIIAVNKSNNDLVQGDITGDKPLSEKVKDYIKEKYGKPGEVFLGVTHRLDRPVSGVVLFARTSKALTRLNEMFKQSEIKKTYWAITKNRPRNDEDTLVHHLSRNTKYNKSYAFPREGKNTKRAELSFKVLGSSDNYHLLAINLKTGRHHQIRVQLSAIGCPIKGDIKYGAKRTNDDGGISLHAREIQFIHPVKNEEIKITAPTPHVDKIWRLFDIK